MKNPPAFPCHPETPSEYDGMTLRDYFAAKGLEALMVAVTSELQSKHHSNEKAHEIKMLYAKTCYAMADAMMKAREE
jgi:hypothetical protein